MSAISFRLGAEECDATAFEAAVEKGDTESLEHAVKLYRGPLLEGCDEEWVLTERETRQLAYLNALEKLADSALEENNASRAATFLRISIAAEPLRETTHRNLMRALALSRDYGGAVMAYRSLRLLLRREVNSEPDPDTTALLNQIRADARARAELRPVAPAPRIGHPNHASRGHAPRTNGIRKRHTKKEQPRPAARTSGRSVISELISWDSLRQVPTNFPRQITSFIGREAEKMAVKQLLASDQLVTLVGAGGSGKTRLALQAADEAREEFPDGVWFVELASLSDSSQVPRACASAIGLREEQGRSALQTLEGFLASKRLLLMLDNCEHLSDGCEELAANLLRACSAIRLLATSRAALGLPGERCYRVPPLSVPDPNELLTAASLARCDSVRLFVDRASLCRPDFSVNEDNASVVGHVCRALDGIPLALELAAARLRAMSLEQLADRLEDRFGVLTGGSLTLPVRQRSLRAALDWSYDLLDNEERDLLLRLSVFAGGWTLEAAVAISDSDAAETLDIVTSLVDKSLIIFDSAGNLGRERYLMLETIRQYAVERLRQSGNHLAARTRHREYFLSYVEGLEELLSGPDQVAILDAMERDHANIRAALTSYRTGGEEYAEEGLRLAGALQRFWHRHGHLTEGREQLAAMLAIAAEDCTPAVKSKAITAAAILAYRQSDYAMAQAYHEEALRIREAVNDQVGAAYSIHNLANVAYEQGDFGRARPLYERSLGMFRELDRLSGIADSLSGIGLVAYRQSEHAVACSLFQETLAIREQLGDISGIAAAFNNLGNVHYELGEYDSALEYHEQSLKARRTLCDPIGIASSLNNLGTVTGNQGRYDASMAYFEESLAIRRELGDRTGIAMALNNLGSLVSRTGDYDLAKKYHTESLAMRRELGEQIGMATSLNNLGIVAYHQGELEAARTYREESLEIARSIGSRHTVAISLISLGVIASSQGEYAKAWKFQQEALSISHSIRDKRLVAYSLEAIGSLASVSARSDNPTEPCLFGAATLWGAADARRDEVGSPLSPVEQKAHDSEIASTAKVIGQDAFDRAWSQGRSMEPENAVNLALNLVYSESSEAELPALLLP